MNKNSLAIFLGFLFALKICFAQTADKEKKFLGRTRQLILEGKRSGEGYFSADGKKIIFQAEREKDNPFYQIYILNFETTEVHRVSPGWGKTTCAFFRNGTNEVLFSSTHHDPKSKEYQEAEFQMRQSGMQRRYAWDYDPMMDIYIAKEDGSNLRAVASAMGYDAEASFSPDGQFIVFASNRHAYNSANLTEADQNRLEKDPAYFNEIYIMKADGSGLRKLTNMPGYDGGPFFAPDGQRIIFRHFNEEGTIADIYTIALDGSDLRQLTNFNSMSWAPYYHPSGKYVIFASNKLGFSNFELFIVDVEGKNTPVQVTFTDGFDGLPVFSPDGKQLAWTSNRTSNGSAQIFIADWIHEAALNALNLHQAKPEQVQSQNTLPGKLHQPDITAQEISEIVHYLASDELEGRMTGSKGEAQAAQYIQIDFQNNNIKPLKDDYRILFEFLTDSKVNKTVTKSELNIFSKEHRLNIDKDFSVMSLSSNGTAVAPLAFAGYGIQVSGKGDQGYDTYQNLEVKGKTVIVLTGLPPNLSPDRKKNLQTYADPRYKAMVAREKGAVAIIFISNDPQKPLFTASSDNSLASSGIIAISLHRKFAEKLLKKQGFSKIEKILADGTTSAETAFPIENCHAEITVRLDRQVQTAYNVVGYIPPKENSSTKNQYIVIGAHYDHLGKNEIPAASLNNSKHTPEIHNGADDNASGTAVVMELAEYFIHLRYQKPDLFNYGLVFALWSGEELGLVGSSQFMFQNHLKPEEIKAYLNFDMVGNLRDNKLILQGTSSAPEWNKLLERQNITAGFNLVLQPDPYLPTDATSFYLKRVPILSFFTGITSDYHKPTDDAHTLNYEGAARIGQFAQKIIEQLLNPETTLSYQNVESSQSMSGKRKSSVYFGTIPDYSSGGKGVKLSGTKAGSPAEKAGLQPNDIIIELDGKKIENIYDYTYKLDELQIGKTVSIIILRSGQEVKLNITPASKD